MRIFFWEFIHNVVAHPLMSLTLNSNFSIWFHNWTGDKAWPDENGAT